MDEEKNKKIAFQFLKYHPLMTLSTVSSSGVPQSAVVYVYLKDDFTAYFVSAGSTRKYANIMENDNVSLSAHDENVLIFGELLGTSEVLRDQVVIKEILPELQKIIAARKSDYWVPPVTQLEGDEYVFFKVNPYHIHLTNYTLTDDIENAKPKVFDIDLS